MKTKTVPKEWICTECYRGGVIKNGKYVGSCIHGRITELEQKIDFIIKLLEKFKK